MKYRKVNKTDIAATMRFDGSYHNAPGNVYTQLVTKHSSKSLAEYCVDIFTSGRNKRVYTDQAHGVPFLSNSDTSSAHPFTSCKYSSKKYGFDSAAVLKPGMILTGRVGAIGQTSFVPPHWIKHNAMGSDNIIRVVTKDGVYNGFIYAFLASKIGTLIIQKHSTGGVQPFITDAMLGTVPIPDFPLEFQEKVDGMIKESARLREEAADALEKAVAFFDNTYHIDSNFTKTFPMNIQSVRNNFAAYNNNIEVDDFISQYAFDAVRIGDLASRIFAPSLFKHIYLSYDNGHPFMTGSELTQYNLRFYRWLSPRGVKNIEDYKVKEGTLLLYKSGTTDGGILGQVFIADKKLDGCCLSDHVIRVVIEDKPVAYWAFAFLRSKGGVKMLQRLSTGTMIPFITPERLENILIPSPDSNLSWISNNIQQYIDFSSKSKQLELEAIAMVEAEIEKWIKE